MAFSDFDLKTARERFNLDTDEGRDLFGSIAPLEPTAGLRQRLETWAPVAAAMNTEKARSEMIIAPILMEAVELARQPVRLFSGVTFDVDKEQGLNGACDFLLTRAPERYYIRHPAVAIVEAKKEDITAGVGQCVAAMVAARLYNEREGDPTRVIHGAVTTGTNWRFLRLQEQTVFIDVPEYYLGQVAQILGILVHMANGPDTQPAGDASRPTA